MYHKAKLGIKKRSKVPGVMITQYVEELPEGKTTPDFLRKPIALTIQEGKLAIFKAVVSGIPKPEVTWKRAKGDMADQMKFQVKYDESSGEYTLQIPKVSGEEADTYKCFAINEYGKAVCTATLNVIEGPTTDPAEFRKLLRKSAGRKVEEKKDGEIDEKFWEILLSAEKKDYERICKEFGVTDFRWMLKKLNELKREREEEQAMYIDAISNLKHIEVKADGSASFELDLELKDPSSRIFLYKDGVMIPYSKDMEMKHNLRQVGKKLVFTIKDLLPEDAGLYQVDVEEVNVFSTEFKIPNIDFIVKIQEVKAKEREDAIFECVLSHPFARILWMGKNAQLEDGEKYQITVSEDKLIHRLRVRDCMQLDKGIYSAVAGIKTCSAWLIVEADSDPAPPGKKKARKTTQAGGATVNLEKVAQEQQVKLQKEREEKLEVVRKAQEEKEVAKAAEAPVEPVVDGGDGLGEGSGLDNEPKLDDGLRLVNGSNGAALDSRPKLESRPPPKLESHPPPVIVKEDRPVQKIPADDVRDSGPVKEVPAKTPPVVDQDDGAEDQTKKRTRTGPLVPDTVIGHIQVYKTGKLGTEGLQTINDMTPWTQTGPWIQIYKVGKLGTEGLQTIKGMIPWTQTGSWIQVYKTGKLGTEGLQTVNDTTPWTQTGPWVYKTGKLGTEGLQTIKGMIPWTQTGLWIQVYKTGKLGTEGLQTVNDTTPWTQTGPWGQENRQGKGQGNQQANGQGSGQGEGKEQGKQMGKESVQGNGRDKGQEDGGENRQENGQEGSGEAGRSTKRTRQGPLLSDKVIDPGVQFISGLSDVNAVVGQPAELMCKLSSESCEGAWFKDGKQLSSTDGVTVAKDGPCHKLIIKKCQEEDTGKYRFEADGRKTEAVIIVEDPPRLDPDDLAKFSQPVIVKAGQNASFKMPFVGREPVKVQWYKEGEELVDDTNVVVEKAPAHSRLLLSRCQRKDTGEIKIKLKNDFGTIEALSRLIVLDKPTPPQGPVEVAESSASCIEIKWRPPKDDGGSPVKGYSLERQQTGRNTWTKLGEIASVTAYRDTDVDHGRKYCYRIRAVSEEGVSEMMETNDIMAGTKVYPGPPAAPKIVSAFMDCINLSWTPPTNTGGSRILGYHLEKRKKGSNLWSPVNPVNEPIQDKKYAVKDVVTGMSYEFRVAAVNISGAGEPSVPSDFVIARDPKKAPGKVIDLKVVDSTYTTLSLSWTKPTEQEGVQDEAKGYFVEIRPAESTDWIRCNAMPVIMTSFMVKGLKSMGMYWVRVIATNEGGEGEPQDLDNYIIAMPPPVRPKFTDTKMKTFMVVRAGNSVRVNVNYEASPWPDVVWLKDNMPVSKRVTITNAEGTSQLLIPSSERSDTGVYTIIVKNLVGQETFSIEIRVTDDPKPPGPVELEENVPGTVTVVWEPSPDEKRDDRLHYMVSKRDSSKQTWQTVADRLFNNKFTACNIMPGCEYHFRVYAKNDMGLSEPSESPTWGTTRKRDKFTVNMPRYRPFNFQSAPKFLVPLKLHMAPPGYECYMSCAVSGNPKPHVTWYRNNISLNTNTNYYISNTCGVCSMLILRVGPKDHGEYTVMAENTLGRAECSTSLTVRE
ncbi:immunoglobulin-like and fibronectin type III domain-containing protein 1 [Megalops cyprinoides]|uniref:immunoglobulin-like and fibronectin type III domain-containing protein 1 n=1 Tax=Megalops cyprinoides TaxID=118141 RepID=UPI001864ABD8|nr:immunoglobulin-like and fibronectin type III domain-containing protein 1 [Megalops cyprinoides]